MKQLIFVLLLTAAGTAGVFLYNPFWGVAVYYLFAVLRPQFIWEWALRYYVNVNESSWSFYVAVCTIIAMLTQKFRVFAVPKHVAADQQQPPALTTAHFCMFLFGFWVTLAYVFADDQEAAWPWFIEYVKIFVMYFVSARLIHSVRQLWALMILVAISLGYIAYEVNFIFLQTRRITIYHNGYGGMDNNGAGLMLAMGVPLCLFVWEGSQRWWRWIFAAFIPVLIHAVLMSFSRGAMVALLLGTPLMVMRSRYKFYLSLALGGLIMVLPLMAGAEIQQRFFSIEQFDKDGSAQSRFGSWMAALQIASLNPINGVGLRNANIYAKQFGADFEGRAIHSQYLQIAADCGFVGLAIYLATILWALLNIRRVRRMMAYREDPEAVQAVAVASGAECSLFVFGIGAAFLSLEVFELPYLMLLLGAQLGAIVESRSRRSFAMRPQVLSRAAAS